MRCTALPSGGSLPFRHRSRGAGMPAPTAPQPLAPAVPPAPPAKKMFVWNPSSNRTGWKAKRTRAYAHAPAFTTLQPSHVQQAHGNLLSSLGRDARTRRAGTAPLALPTLLRAAAISAYCPNPARGCLTHFWWLQGSLYTGRICTAYELAFPIPFRWDPGVTAPYPRITSWSPSAGVGETGLPGGLRASRGDPESCSLSAMARPQRVGNPPCPPEHLPWFTGGCWAKGRLEWRNWGGTSCQQSSRVYLPHWGSSTAVLQALACLLRGGCCRKWSHGTGPPHCLHRGVRHGRSQMPCRGHQEPGIYSAPFLLCASCPQTGYDPLPQGWGCLPLLEPNAHL